jgi:hypothetical protein
MLPTEDISRWAKLEGEIRPSGRNSYKVWSPKQLMKSLKAIDAVTDGDIVSIKLSNITATKGLGGTEITRFKISPLFFVRAAKIKFERNKATFKLDSVRQLNPSITAKMNFKGLKVDEVRKFYLELLKK